MSERLRVILLVVVLIYALISIRLIHRKRLSLNYSLLWVLLALILLLMIIFPQLIYSLSGIFGIDLPVNMLFTGFAFFTMVMLFYLTCIVSKDNEKNRALVQQVALLEKQVRDLEKRLGEGKTPSETEQKE